MKIIPFILTFLLLGCTLTPQEKEEMKLREAKEAQIKAAKSMMMVKCMMTYGGKNASPGDYAQIQKNFAARAICKAELGL